MYLDIYTRRTVKDQNCSCYNSYIYFTTRRSFSGIAKDALPTTALNNVIYKYTYRCERTYVGKTSQIFQDRIKQHVPEKLLNLVPGAKAKTAISDSAITKHLMTSNDCIPTDPVERLELLTRARNKSHLDVLEALFIKSLTPELCAQKEFVRVKLFV